MNDSKLFFKSSFKIPHFSRESNRNYYYAAGNKKILFLSKELGIVGVYLFGTLKYH
mgnify:CR=1 FL=1